MKKILAAAAVIALISGCKTDPAACIVRVHGSTTVYPLIRAAADSLSKKKKLNIELTSPGSTAGYRDLLEGKCDIFDSSYKISPAEFEAFSRKGLDVKEHLLAYDLVVPIVNRNNPLHEITIEQLSTIFTGGIADWKNLNGGSGSISVFCRDENSGTGRVWNSRFLSAKKTASGCRPARSNSEVLSFVAHEPGAIGYISRAFINNDVKMLRIKGYSSEGASIKKHPGYRELYLYVNRKSDCPQIKSLIIFLLSDDGKNLIRQNGFIPVD